MDSIAEALAAVRPGEGRLVGAPWREVARAGAPRLDGLALEHSARRDTPTSQRLRDEAVVALLGGKIDDAIDKLSRATELEPKDGALWNDLAVARLERGRAMSDPHELFLALIAAHRAVRQAPNLLAARFNRALALGKLALFARAAEDWAFLEQHDEPAWRREARERLSALERPAGAPDDRRDLAAAESAVAAGRAEEVRTIVARSPQRFRVEVEENLLPQWAVAEKRQDRAEAAHLLKMARSIAGALAASGGDRMAADTVAQIGLLRSTDPAGCERLAAGFLDYSRGLALSGKSWTQALDLFRSAEARLKRDRSPFVHRASYQIAVCHFQQNRYRQARSVLEKLILNLRGQPYPALRGYASYLVGVMDGVEGKQGPSAKALKAALVAFDESREMAAAAKTRGELAIDLATLGQLDEAWRELQPALVEPSSFARPEIRGLLYTNGSTLAEGQGEIEIALWFLDQGVSELERAGRQDGLAGTFCKRASLLAALGRRAEARRDLGEARKSLARVTDPITHQGVEGDVLLAEAALAATESPGQAIARLDGAISIFAGTAYHYRIGRALYLRAQAARTLGKDDDAERDLRAAIGELERQRETIATPGDRISYLDRRREIFDTMIAFQLERRRRDDLALGYSEEAKARVLSDWMLAGPSRGPGRRSPPPVSPTLNLRALQASLPEGTAVVEYAVLPQKSILWVLRRQGKPQSTTIGMGAEGLGDLVRKLRRAGIDGRAAELEMISEQLHDLLIRPIASFLPPGDRLVLIPDGALHLLPFALLRDRKTGHYLMENHILTTVPSLRALAASRRRDLELARRQGLRALVVAAPDFDHDLNPSLFALSAGEAEVSLARTFPGSRVLQGGVATRRAFLRAAGDFEIVHFGGHSVINAEFPLLSKMLFAPSRDDSQRGELFAADVLARRFPHTRLMVLASCSTAAGRLSRTEGVESLARPFLAAGVPTVIASLWSVDDRATADFFVRFYDHLAKLHDIGRALQAAQIDALRQGSGDGDPRIWGAFELIGSGTLDASMGQPAATRDGSRGSGP